MVKCLCWLKDEKSRRDDTLLTVGFNLRSRDAACHVSTSPAGTTLITGTKCRPCGTWALCAALPVRRLKPTVNRVSSLRDFSPLHMRVSTLQGCAPLLWRGAGGEVIALKIILYPSSRFRKSSKSFRICGVSKWSVSYIFNCHLSAAPSASYTFFSALSILCSPGRGVSASNFPASEK